MICRWQDARKAHSVAACKATNSIAFSLPSLPNL